MNYQAKPAIHPKHKLLHAPIRRRAAAFLLEWIVLILVYFSIIQLCGCFDMNITNIDIHSIFDAEMEMENTTSLILPLLKILSGLLPIFYFTLSFHRFKGQTIGKYLFRLRVFSLYHERLCWWHATERSPEYFASALEFGFGLIQAWWNPNRMTLHDKIGETIIIQLPSRK